MNRSALFLALLPLAGCDCSGRTEAPVVGHEAPAETPAEATAEAPAEPAPALAPSTPELPSEASRVQIDAGFRHTCVRSRDGSVTCWGSHSLGQVGAGPEIRDRVWDFAEEHGTRGMPLLALPPSRVVGLEDAVDLSCAGDACCVARETGDVACWGAVPTGEARPASFRGEAAPVPIAGLSGAVQVAVDTAHVCARLRDGKVSCWGDGAHGALGDGRTRSRERPREVEGLVGATALSTGWGGTCVLTAEGATSCWGMVDRRDRLAPEPVALPALDGDRVLLEGCVLVGGRPVCWGAPLLHHTGRTLGDDASPAPLGELQGVVAMDLGSSHGCAVLRDGQLSCWGDNGAGELGDGTTTSRSQPAVVAGIDHALDVAVGDHHTCVLTARDEVLCFGLNGTGEVTGEVPHGDVPRQVTSPRRVLPGG